MSTIPSISLIPSGYKANKVYSVLPTDGAADLTFARTSSANRVNSDNLIEEVATGVPRLDYTGGGCPSLLLEPQSANLITYPLSFDNAYWNKAGAGISIAPSVTSNYSISPDGTQNADRIIFDLNGGSTSSDFSQLQSSQLVMSGDYTNSIYLKSNTGSNYTFTYTDPTGSTTTITVTSEWIRFDTTAISVSTTTEPLKLRLRGGSEATSIYADISIFGAQIEQQSFATSLMLPNTEGSTVTRVAETASKTGLESYIGQTEGYIYVHFTRNGNEVSRGGLVYLRQASFRGLSINYGSNKLYFTSRNNSGLDIVEIKSSFLINETAKVAINYDNNGGVAGGQGVFDAYINGVKVITEGVYNIPDINIDELRLSYGSNSGSDSEVTANAIKEFRNGKTNLADSEYITLTTI